ncbi:MAG: hypothetical protein ACLT1C_10005 [Weissella confusa]
MFNSDVKKAAIANLQKKADEMNAVVKDTTKHSEELYTVCVRSQEQIQHSIDLINQLKNTPIEIDTKIEKIKVSMKNYTRILEATKADAANVDMKAGGAMAGGVAMGVGVAALGPAAAMGIATTFGVASTGAAISGLSGIAATNAALAWLGGGALAAGGAGVAGGEAFLALAGPIGWAIGGAALVGVGLFMNGKNKKIASEANQKAAEIVAQTKTQKVINQEIAEMINLTSKDVEYLNEANEKVELMDKDFNNLDDSSVYFLGAYVNNVSTTVERLNAIIGEHGYTVSQKRALKL